MTSLCPRCETPRDQRDGPYFVCAECRWCWTMSITGRVYVECKWPRVKPKDDPANRMVRRMLSSVDGLEARLRLPEGDEQSSEAALKAAGFGAADIIRMRRARAATAADFFNEGLPLSELRANGIRLPPE